MLCFSEYANSYFWTFHTENWIGLDESPLHIFCTDNSNGRHLEHEKQD